MSKSFQGVINVDIRDSVPDWSPFKAPKAPDGAPNVLYIVLDDVGFSALGSYGGPIPTPNIDRIGADDGRYTPSCQLPTSRSSVQPACTGYSHAGTACSRANRAPWHKPRVVGPDSMKRQL
jgi:Sulfatase